MLEEYSNILSQNERATDGLSIDTRKVDVNDTMNRRLVQMLRPWARADGRDSIERCED